MGLPTENSNPRRATGDDMLVSVIVPVYNVRPYLAEALDSVLRQTYGNLEVVVVDDGSTDGSGELCDDYASRDGRIVVVHQENGGLSAARNAGIDLAHGDAIAFLDSDDAFDESYVELLVAAMVREQVDVSACRYSFHPARGPLTRDGKPRRKRSRVAPSIEAGVYGREDALRAIAAGKINVSVWNKLYRRELWESVRYPVGHVYEDIDTTFRVFDLITSLCVIDQSLYLHRMRPGSITYVRSVENVTDGILARSHFEEYVEAHPEVFTPELRQLVRVKSLRGLVAGYARCSETGEEARAFLKDLRGQIVELGRAWGTDGMGRLPRIAYRMALSCPWLLRAAYHPYRLVRQMRRGVMGR